MAESRAYIPNNRRNSNPDILSRMQQDLSTSPHQDGFFETNGTGTKMLRRAAGKIPHVCVVGAGAAGLRCADVLLQHGVKVTLLEARDRIGGRVSVN
jgi:NADPH-dependent 2,4-dienoyl-CoA reductase/sulfur reductase-like enzyme